MMDALHTNKLHRNPAGNNASGEREFPSFRLDTVSTNAAFTVEGTRGFAPLRFTLDPSKWNNGHGHPHFVGPTLISPPGRRDGGTTPTTKQNSHEAPLFPSMEEFKTNKSLKRPATAVPPTSFLPYKKRAITSTISSDSNEAEPSDRRSPEYLLQLAKEPGMQEAASILLDMRTLVGTNRNKEAPTSTLKDSAFASLDGTVEAASKTLEGAPTNSHEDQQEPIAAAASATRTVTPAPSGMRLALPEDAHELNSLHCFVRAELLELFALPEDGVSTNQVRGSQSRSSRRTSTTITSSGRSYASGRVGLRCVYCAHLPRRARAGSTMSSFYPKSLSDLYRSVCTWQRIHFKSCRHIPPQVREGYWQLKESDRTRGKTRYWVNSAQRIGLVDIGSERGGICFATSPTTTVQS
jgi:hypothetical protein